MNSSPAQETDDTYVHLQTLLHRVRQALNECPADSLLTVHTLRAWLDIRIRYEEELKGPSVANYSRLASRNDAGSFD
jgi:hypothetical protein